MFGSHTSNSICFDVYQSDIPFFIVIIPVTRLVVLIIIFAPGLEFFRAADPGAGILPEFHLKGMVVQEISKKNSPAVKKGSFSLTEKSSKTCSLCSDCVTWAD